MFPYLYRSKELRLCQFNISLIVRARRLEFLYLLGEWEKLKEKYEGLEETAEAMPEWYKHVVRDRLAEYKANPHIAVPLEEALTALENE